MKHLMCLVFTFPFLKKKIFVSAEDPLTTSMSGYALPVRTIAQISNGDPYRLRTFRKPYLNNCRQDGNEKYCANWKCQAKSEISNVGMESNCDHKRRQHQQQKHESGATFQFATPVQKTRQNINPKSNAT